MVHVRAKAGGILVTADGDVDPCSLGALCGALENEPQSRTAALEIDLTRVSFCCTDGLTLLMHLSQRCAESHRPCRFAFSRAVSRPLRLLGWLDHMQIRDEGIRSDASDTRRVTSLSSGASAGSAREAVT
ncbi:hypothetical protein CFN78_21760 [Amycolatopsis antarctica]|uniref:Uncharacterized protein n=1 Tax=Amycolatopsis antarctica TaxID=1854586 RepID=A0A263CYX3_9PSEU|nr:hypothetical protein CFN78_21760 [Amycolatopsis antarctica]